ncbi:hypothetical protein VB005_09378 [Metarhizium brunneum]
MDFGAKICIRSDFIQFLEMNLPRWGQYGLWGRDKGVSLTTSAQAHLKLQHAYSYVCSLDSRMKEDAIRSRMAIVLLYLEFERICQGTKSRQARIKTAVGRGYISCMIDNILESTHPEWRTSNNRAKANMRAHFHNQKRYGKRWWILVNGLGHGILLLCSSRLAGLVRNTTLATASLCKINQAANSSESETMDVLKLVNPISESLFRNDKYQNYNTKQLLEQLRGLGPLGYKGHE